MIKTEQWRICEILLESKASYQNPFLDVEVQAVFRSESGRAITLLAFWDGGSTWKVRFAPTETGLWTFQTRASCESDAGLHGVTGTVECLAYSGPHDIFRHGFLKVGPQGRYLAHDDNTPFFWLGDTHWTFVTEERFDESNCPKYTSQFKACVDRRAEQKFNVYQCNFRDGKDFHAFGRYDEYLVETENGLQPDIAFLQQNPDRKMQYLADKGFVIVVGFSWGGAILGEGHLDRYKLLARYLVARYGAYPVVWTLAGELPGYGGGDEAREMTDRWREVALVTEQADGYGALQSFHQANDRPFPAIYMGERWYDFAMSQAGHGDRSLSADMYRDYAGKHPGFPLVESESLYEGIQTMEENGPRAVTPAMLRRVAWLCLQHGGCGYTYGACGVWELQWEAAKPGEFWSFWGSLAWYDGLELPGADQLTIMRDFYERVGWHRLRPIPELIEPSFRFGSPVLMARLMPAFTADEAMRTVVAYFAPSGGMPITYMIRTLTAVSYTARWFDPATGEYTLIDADARPVAGCWQTPVKPGTADRVLLLEAN